MTFSWHGLLTVLAMLVSIGLGLHWAKKAGLYEEMLSALVWAVPAGVIGARLVHVIDRWNHYSADPKQVLAFWEGGLSLYGAILGGVAVGALYAKIRGLPVGRLADIAAPGLIVAQVIGRIGCVINGDAYGTPTSLPWGVVYTHRDAYAPLGVAGHPSAFYEIIWDLIVLAMLLRLRGRLRPEGSLIPVYLVFYSMGRFLISWTRGDELPVIGPLHQAHVISLIIFIIGIAWLIYTKVRWAKSSLNQKDASQPG